MSITARMVKDLRDTTGVGMMDAKKALVENNGDFEAATDWLKQKGFAKAQKKSNRIAAEGLVAVKVATKKAIILEVNCETDFVSKNQDFQQMVTGIMDVSLDKMSLEEVLKGSVDGNRVEDILIEKVSAIGENISLRRFSTLDYPFVTSYIHNAFGNNLGKIGVLVALATENPELGKQLAMHIAASNPLALSENDLPADLLEREKRVFLEQAKESGKSQEILENMVKGKLKKFISEVTLLNQSFVIDPDVRVSKVLSKNNNQILDFVRFEVGEGLEKS